MRLYTVTWVKQEWTRYSTEVSADDLFLLPGDEREVDEILVAAANTGEHLADLEEPARVIFYSKPVRALISVKRVES